MSAAIAGRSAPSDIPAPMPGGAHVRRRAPAWPRAAATALAALLLTASMALSQSLPFVWALYCTRWMYR